MASLPHNIFSIIAADDGLPCPIARVGTDVLLYILDYVCDTRAAALELGTGFTPTRKSYPPGRIVVERLRFDPSARGVNRLFFSFVETIVYRRLPPITMHLCWAPIPQFTIEEIRYSDIWYDPKSPRMSAAPPMDMMEFLPSLLLGGLATVPMRPIHRAILVNQISGIAAHLRTLEATPALCCEIVDLTAREDGLVGSHFEHFLHGAMMQRQMHPAVTIAISLPGDAIETSVNELSVLVRDARWLAEGGSLNVQFRVSTTPGAAELWESWFETIKGELRVEVLGDFVEE
jgi:hypothetical protein